MNPSERIKAALARPEAARTSTHSPAMRPPADVGTTLPLLGATDAARIALPSDATSSRTPPLDSAAKVESGQATVNVPRLSRTWRMYAALAVLALVAVSVVLIRQRTPAPKQAGPASNLQVAVTHEGNGLLSVRWNPKSTAIARAREGRLVIQEPNQQPKIVRLQAEELKTGHIYYESLAEHLEIRLEVVNGPGEVVGESVLSVLPATGPVAPAPSQPAHAQDPATKSQVATKMGPQSEKPSPLTPEPPAPAMNIADAPQPTPAAPRAFTPPPSATPRTIEEASTVLLDPSAPLPARITAPARVSLPQIGSVAAPPVKPPAPNSTAAIRPGGSVEPATLVRKVAPVYPVIARTARIQGTVKFTALVDKNGKVQNLQFVSGPQMLVQAASDAVRKWLYRPMLLNGKPTEVITQIEVKFTLAQ